MRYIHIIALILLCSNVNAEFTTRHREIRDTNGRTVTFHGVNAIVKGYPWVPTQSFDPFTSLSQTDFSLMREHGVNFIRLGIMWPGVEPVRGNIDYSYLNNVRDITRQAAKYGVYTLLDMHQNLFSEKFCGEGFPEWLPLSTPYIKFPAPFMNNTCNEVNWAKHQFSFAVNSAYQDLYNNNNGIMNMFGDFWETVTRFFVDESQIVGFELINEPWAGNVYSNPFRLIPHITNYFNLEPMYTYLARRIHNIDPSRLIFIEGITWSDLGLGFSRVPNNTVLSYHYYYPPQFALEAQVNNYFTQSIIYDVPSVLTEFDYKSFGEIEKLKDIMTSWTIWEYKSFCTDTFGACITGHNASFFDNNGKINKTTWDRVAQPYAPYLSGTYLRTYQNKHNFTFEYLANNGDSEFYIPRSMTKCDKVHIIEKIGVNNYTSAGTKLLVNTDFGYARFTIAT